MVQINNRVTAFINGRFYTMREEGETCQAVAVRDGKFIYCGSNEKAAELAKGNVVDLKGKTVLPGFIDDHQHVQAYARNLLKVDLTDACSIEDVKERVRVQAAKVGPGKLILGSGFDQTKFSEKRLPTRWDLDAAAPQNPVVVTRYCLHVNVANSMALERGGIRREMELPEGIERSEDGELTGCMLEREAAELVNAITDGADLSYEELKDAVCGALHQANSFGITGVHPIQGKLCNLFEQTYLYQDLRDEGRLTCRICLGDDELTGCSIRSGLGDEMVRFGFYKIYTDGSLGGRTALMTRPYHDSPSETGACHYNQEQLDEMVKAAYDRHLQTAVHAIGDKAVEMTLTALKRAYDANPRPWDQIRFRLTHCSLINDKILGMLKEMPMIIDMQPGYVSTNIHWSDDRVGKERAPYLFAWKTLMNAGQTLCGSSDLPCENLNPMVGVYAVETRSGYDGYMPEGWQPQERLSRYEAVCLYTKNAAYASFEETRKGTIEVGKLADFAVFDQDVFSVAAPELLKLRVEKTYLSGKEIYSRK
ncbi:amidohydrolase [Oscillibacter hominis]|uniref:Amidohydrolase n=1 Tax=Oscillibacter hominis TaxID=2763056 RepID=A0A7G9B357_9FIRM|nr:amidohydrolase [Oscillibacter hominis]QNL43988.1 amidohydrolase [Oscillibacter hominis]